MRSTALIVLVVLSAACGLSVVGAPSGSAPDSGADGGARPDAAGDGSSGADGSAQQLDGGACTVLIDDSFSNEDARWEKFGEATFETDQVRLTPRDNGGTAGAIWWRDPLTFTGSLHVELRITVGSYEVTPGDGIALGWVSTPYHLGLQGQSFGLCSVSITGVGVAADTRDSDLLLIDAIGSSCQTTGGVIGATIANDSQMVVDIRADGLTASLNGAMGSRPATIPKTGWIGITASTGGGESAHIVKSVRVTSCP
jgi:hypothetical protein